MYLIMRHRGGGERLDCRVKQLPMNAGNFPAADVIGKAPLNCDKRGLAKKVSCYDRYCTFPLFGKCFKVSKRYAGAGRYFDLDGKATTASLGFLRPTGVKNPGHFFPRFFWPGWPTGILPARPGWSKKAETFCITIRDPTRLGRR